MINTLLTIFKLFTFNLYYLPSAEDVYVQTAGISKNGPISNSLFGWSDPRYHGDAMIMMNNELVPRLLTWSEFVMFKPSY